MASSSVFYITLLISLSTLCSVFSLNLQTYIVHVKPAENFLVDNSDALESYYRSFLPQTITNADDRLVYSYSQVFSGFAARLTDQELQEMSKKQGFLRTFPNTIIPLLTTHTPDFLGLTGTSGLWNRSNLGKGVIVGVLDTGILPGHPSFNDDGISPPPSKWRGKCDFDTGCNNKIIGAVGFNSSGFSGNSTVKASPADDVGHGTHTASTIAGNFVKNVNLFGQANGMAAGMAPHAHLAIYKVCNPNGCSAVDILAGLDKAVKDGVDILSLSLGGVPSPFDQDPIAIGTFRAFQKGITIVCAAGNDGPGQKTVTNDAPWILTVAASTVDRSFRARVRLGNGKVYSGEALYQPSNFSSRAVSLVYPEECSNVDGVTLDLKGKIVVCKMADPDTINYIFSSGAVGVIIVNDGAEGYVIMVRNYPLASSSLSYADASKIKKYTESTHNPTASIIFNGTVLGTSPAPVIAFFSSRGPSQIIPGVLKPDVTAPGVNIFAAWNNLVDQNAKAPFNIISGTSMATPHVSGIAALIKSVHPDWSPAAIKSAIITSSDILGILDEQHKNASFYVSGAGHVNPSKSANPGLVYEVSADDYIAYLCGLLGKERAAVIVPGNFSCDKTLKDVELNYPTITSPLTSNTVTVNRTVTNVGKANANYTVDLSDVPKGLTVDVKPEMLQFLKVNEKKSFTVSLTWSKNSTGGQANLKWVSGKTVVRSAIAFTTPSV